MEFLYCGELTDTGYLADIRQLLYECDKEFVPPLSHRESPIQSTLSSDTRQETVPAEYFEAMRLQSFVLALEGGHVCGFMSFRGGYLPPVLSELSQPGLLPLYITTIIVSPQSRRHGLARRFYSILMDLFPERRRLISTRTWSTNGSHIALLTSLGFSGPVRIKDDRGPGIDTVYYYKLLKEDVK